MSPAFQAWLQANIDFPALVYAGFLLFGLWAALRVQKNHPAFDFASMLMDDSGKPSATRLGTMFCLVTSTWVVMYHTVYTKGQVDPWIFGGYVTIWSGAKIAEKIVDLYLNRGAPPPQPTTQSVGVQVDVSTTQQPPTN